MADDPLLSREVDAAGFAAIMATKPVTKLTRPVKWWLDHSFVTVDSTGTPHFSVDTSGRFTEASAASIKVDTLAINAEQIRAKNADAVNLVATPSASDDYAGMTRHRIFTVPITIAAGGAVTNVALHASVAGYKFHFKVLGIEMDTTDATTNWWFHTTAGGVSCVGCPASPGFQGISLTAATVNTQLTGAYMNNGAATGDVTLLDVAGVGAGAANGYIYIEGWFETT